MIRVGETVTVRVLEVKGNRVVVARSDAPEGEHSA